MPVFEYTGYRNPYGPSIAEALQHQADPQAAAALRSGDIQAQAALQRGALRAQQFSTLGAIPGEIQAERDRAIVRQRAAQQQQIGAQQLQTGALALEDAQAQRAADAQLSKLFAATPRGSDGTYDMRAFLGTVPPELTKYAQKWVQQGNAINESWIADDTRRRGQMQQAALTLAQAGAPFQATLGLIDSAHRDHVLTDEQAAQYKNDVIEQGAPGVLKRLSGPPQLKFIGADQRGIDQAGNVVVPAQGKPGEGDYTVNGVRFHADGTPIGPAVPLQVPARSPEQIALDQARVQEINARLSGKIPLSTKDVQELDLERQRLRRDLANDALKAGKTIDIAPDVQTSMSGKKYLDLSSYTGDARDQARDAAGKQGIPTITKEQASAIQEVDNARANQRDILAQIESLLPAGPAGRAPAWVSKQLADVFQTDEKKAAFGSWRTAAINTLRATAGSKGLRINQAEIAQAIENDIPKLTDTVGVARQKVANITKLLDNVETSIVVRDRSTPAATIRAKDPQGNIHEAAAGTALPAGWTLEP